MAVFKNCKKLGTLDSEDPLKKIRVRFDDPPLTRKENKRLSTYLLERKTRDYLLNYMNYDMQIQMPRVIQRQSINLKRVSY